MSDGFQLIDLVSQAGAVRKLLAGNTDSEKLGWLSGHGKLDIIARKQEEERQAYRFTSVLGREAVFFFDAGEIVFVGDHAAFTVDD